MRILLVALILFVVMAPGALATTQPSLIVGVDVSLKPNTVTVAPKQVRRGYYVQFKVRNTTASRRLFTVAGRTIVIPAQRFRYLVISFEVRGTYRYVSRRASGEPVHGTFTVI